MFAIMLGIVFASACVFTSLTLIYVSILAVKEIYKLLKGIDKKESK